MGCMKKLEVQEGKEGGGLIMSFHKIIWILERPRRADQSAIIRITLSREVRQEAGRSVGARVVLQR